MLALTHAALAVMWAIETHTNAVAGYLWGIPAHRQAWRGVATEDGGRGLYLRFVDVVCTDVQYLLDETLRVLPEVNPRWGPCLQACVKPQPQEQQDVSLALAASPWRS